MRPTKVTVSPLDELAAVVPSSPLIISPNILLTLLPYRMFSLPILIVPLLGKPEESATGIVVSDAVRLEDVVVLAVSKFEALVKVKEVSELLIPPESFKVV